MLTLYLLGITTGGLLLLLALFGGGDSEGSVHGHDGDLDVDADIEVDDESCGERGLDGPDASGLGDLAAIAAAVFPLASVRFWSFFLAFGGLVGALMTWVSDLPPAGVGAMALFGGYATGIGVMRLLRWLDENQVSSSPGRSAWIGSNGTVVLPIARGARGRIRVQLENQMFDFDADTDEDRAFSPRESVVVYEVRDDGVALVTSTDASLAQKGPTP